MGPTLCRKQNVGMILSLEGCLTQIFICIALNSNGLQKIIQIHAIMRAQFLNVGTRPDIHIFNAICIY